MGEKIPNVSSETVKIPSAPENTVWNMVECFKYIKGRANRENLDKMMFEYEQEKSEILNSPLQALIQETLVSLLDHGMNLQSKRGENMIDFLWKQGYTISDEVKKLVMEGQDITITAENKNVILLPLLKNNPINDDIAYLQVTPVEWGVKRTRRRAREEIRDRSCKEL